MSEIDPNTAMAMQDILSEMTAAGRELAAYASYFEIVGAIGHNRVAIRKWCDEVFRLGHELDRLKEEGELPTDEPAWLVRKERDLLRQAVVRYADRSRIGTVEPQELQQAIDDAFEAVPVEARKSALPLGIADAGAIGEAAGQRIFDETPWRWYAGENEEVLTVGPFPSREAVVREAAGQRLGEFLDEADGSWKLAFHVVEARQDPLRLSAYVDAERLLEDAENSLESSDRMTELDEGPIFECSVGQQADLEAHVRRACDDWQARHGLTFRVKSFSHSRNGERLVVKGERP